MDTNPSRAPIPAPETVSSGMTYKRPYVDFYEKNAISPNAQDLSDLDRHFQRREALYRHLGIAPGLVAGARVVEFGPGPGHNALYTASLGPAEYVLVDANSVAVAGARALLDRYDLEPTQWRVVEELIENFSDPNRFDMVLCEGVLSWRADPLPLLQKVSDVVAPGGILVITCIDSVGYFAECLRRLLATVLADPGASTQENAGILTPVFSPHLETLEGMSRSHRDWVIDNLLAPYHGRPFSIGDAILALDGNFDAYGSSPRWQSDRRWYKDVHGEGQQYNSSALTSYHRNLHNHLDPRFPHGPREESDNLALLAACDRVLDLEEAYRAEQSPALLAEVLDRCRGISEIVRMFSPQTAESLDDFVAGLETGDPIPDTGRFAPWFGQGQQYLSLLRRQAVIVNGGTRSRSLPDRP